METTDRRGDRIQVVRSIFQEHDFGNVELLEGWDGNDLEELCDLLTEEEFQTLLDEVENTDEFRTA